MREKAIVPGQKELHGLPVNLWHSRLSKIFNLGFVQAWAQGGAQSPRAEYVSLEGGFQLPAVFEPLARKASLRLLSETPLGAGVLKLDWG